MTIFVDELNTLPAGEAADLLRSCCGATAWVKQMVAKRPFTSNAQLLTTADEVWKGLSTDEKREAFEHHPRIGEKLSAAAQTDTARAFAEREQALVKLASSSVHDQMSLINRAYEQKFGFIYIVSAAGKDGHELMDIARKRLRNDTPTELGIAMEEQRKITRLRLEALIGKGRRMSTISTHVLDTSLGKPAAGIRVTLRRDNSLLGTGTTDDDGRVRDLLEKGSELAEGEYTLSFSVSDYFAKTKRDTFYGDIQISFRIGAGSEHYHVPLLLSPFGYSTYRGS